MQINGEHMHVQSTALVMYYLENTHVRRVGDLIYDAFNNSNTL